MMTSTTSPDSAGILGSSEDDLTRALRQVVSPESAQSLVGSPPDSPAPAGPGETTPQTGSIAGPPKQSVPKNLDTVEGQGSYSVGGLADKFRQQNTSYSHSPGTAQSLASQTPNGTSAAGASSLRPTAGSLPLSPGATATQPAASLVGADNRRVTIRDLNGNPVTSGPRGEVSATYPQIAAELAARASQPQPSNMPNGQQMNPAQPVLQPARPVQPGQSIPSQQCPWPANRLPGRRRLTIHQRLHNLLPRKRRLIPRCYQRESIPRCNQEALHLSCLQPRSK